MVLIGLISPNLTIITGISAFLLAFVCFCISAIYQIVLKPRWHLRNVAGPLQDCATFFSWHMDTIDLMPAGEQHAAWHDRHGSVFVYDGYFKVSHHLPLACRAAADCLFQQDTAYQRHRPTCSETCIAY